MHRGFPEAFSNTKTSNSLSAPGICYAFFILKFDDVSPPLFTFLRTDQDGTVDGLH